MSIFVDARIDRSGRGPEPWLSIFVTVGEVRLPVGAEVLARLLRDDGTADKSPSANQRRANAIAFAICAILEESLGPSLEIAVGKYSGHNCPPEGFDPEQLSGRATVTLSRVPTGPVERRCLMQLVTACVDVRLCSVYETGLVRPLLNGANAYASSTVALGLETAIEQWRRVQEFAKETGR